jgi:predicted DNA-binding protein (MmcQ/YjbR family)
MPKSPADHLRACALKYPGAEEHFPWGERVIKVKGKIFIFLGHTQEDGLALSVKLPHSHEAALMLPFASPTGYGLGKAGWISARFEKKEKPPLELLQIWLDESYRAVAPRTLLAQLEGKAAPAKAAAKKPVRARGKRST